MKQTCTLLLFLIIALAQLSFGQQKNGAVKKTSHKNDTLTILREGIVLPNDVISISNGELIESKDGKKKYGFYLDTLADKTKIEYVFVTIDSKTNVVLHVEKTIRDNAKATNKK